MSDKGNSDHRSPKKESKNDNPKPLKIIQISEFPYFAFIGEPTITFPEKITFSVEIADD